MIHNRIMVTPTKQVAVSARPKPPAAGKGRPKGAVNKTTKIIKEMIVQALNKAGGVNYLLTQAEDNPTAFLTLVGKVLPLQLTGPGDGPITIDDKREAAMADIADIFGPTPHEIIIHG